MSRAEEDEYATTAEYYDAVDSYAKRPDVPFFITAAREAGGPVLELGCGTGRVLIPTARAGVEIMGLDFSDAMLNVCRRKLERESKEVRNRVRLVQGDMRRFELERRFALVTVPFRPFQHLIGVEDQLACLSCIRQHLSDGGRLILDLFDPSLKALTEESRLSEEGFGHELEVALPDGRRMKRWARIRSRNYAEQYQDCELIHAATHPDGRQERIVFAFKMRYLFRFEAEHLLARAGLKVEALYADYEKSPYGSKYPGELIFVAKKT